MSDATGSLPRWPDVFASALVGTARTGERAEVLLDAAAAHAARRRAGRALVTGVRPPGPAELDGVPEVGAEAAARVDTLLALDSASQEALPVRDMASRLELLTAWLDRAAAAGRRLPAELVPALLDFGRRHPELRHLIAEVAGPLAGWLAAQRADWSYEAPAGPTESTVDDAEAWELGSIQRRAAHLTALRRRDPVAARTLLEAGWEAEPPEDRPVLLRALSEGLSLADEPVLEKALDDRRRQVRDVAVDLLAGLPGSAYGQRMAQRALACVDLSGSGPITVQPPSDCDRSMRRDGIVARPPAGTGERAWWLEEVLARTPLEVWPEPEVFAARGVTEGWTGTLRRGLARAAAAQHHRGWTAALVDQVTAAVLTAGRPADRELLGALHEVLTDEELTARAVALLRQGFGGANAVGVDQVLALCPAPWEPGLADAFLGMLEEHLAHHGADWRVIALCDLAGLRLPADRAARAAALVERLRAARPNDPGLRAIARFAETLRFRRDMLEELA